MGIYSSNLGGPHTSVGCNQESGRGTDHYRDCTTQMVWWGYNFNGKLSDQMRDEARAKVDAGQALAEVLAATAQAAGEDAIRAELAETEAKAARLRARLR